jgi:hypothetical protein
MPRTHISRYGKSILSLRAIKISIFFPPSLSLPLREHNMIINGEGKAMAALLNVLRDVLMLLRALKVVYKTFAEDLPRLYK